MRPTYVTDRTGVALTAAEWLWLGGADADRFDRLAMADEQREQERDDTLALMGEDGLSWLDRLPHERDRTYRARVVRPEDHDAEQARRARARVRYTTLGGQSVPAVVPGTRPDGVSPRLAGDVRSSLTGWSLAGARYRSGRAIANARAGRSAQTDAERQRAARERRWEREHEQGKVHTHHRSACDAAECVTRREALRDRKRGHVATVAEGSSSWDRKG